MSLLVHRAWSALAARGLIAILFGVVTLAWPHISLAVLLTLFAIYAAVDGIFAVVASFRAAERRERWWPLLLEGLVGIGFGALTLARPGVTALILLYTIAFWAISTGVLDLLAAIRLRRVLEHEWLLGLEGVLSIVLGVLLFAAPAAGLLTVVWMLGGYAIAAGVILISLSMKLRGTQRTQRERFAPV